MSDLADRLESMVVKVSTPNGMVFGESRAERSVRISFAPGYYERTGTTEMASQLSRLARLMFAETRAEHYRQVSQAHEMVVTRGATPVTRRDHEYQEELAKLVVEGASTDGSVSVTAVGMSSFVISIRPGVVGVVSEASFAQLASEAGTRLVEDQIQKVAKLRWDVYIDMPFPEPSGR